MKDRPLPTLSELREKLLKFYAPETIQPKKDQTLKTSWSLPSITRVLSNLGSYLFSKLPDFPTWLSSKKDLTPEVVNNEIKARARTLLKDILFKIAKEDEPTAINTIALINEQIAAVSMSIGADTQAAIDRRLLTDGNSMNHAALLEEHKYVGYCLLAIKNLEDLTNKTAEAEEALEQDTTDIRERAKAAYKSARQEIASIISIELSKPRVSKKSPKASRKMIENGHKLSQLVKKFQEEKYTLETEARSMIDEVTTAKDFALLKALISDLTAWIEVFVPNHNRHAEESISLVVSHIAALEEVEGATEENLDAFFEPQALQRLSQYINETVQLVRNAALSYTALRETRDALEGDTSAAFAEKDSTLQIVMQQINSTSVAFYPQVEKLKCAQKVDDYERSYHAWLADLRSKKADYTRSHPTCFDTIAQKKELSKIDTNLLFIPDNIIGEVKLALQDAEKKLKDIDARNREIDEEATRAAFERVAIVKRETISGISTPSLSRASDHALSPSISPDYPKKQVHSMLKTFLTFFQKNKWKILIGFGVFAITTLLAALTFGFGVIAPAVLVTLSVFAKVGIAAGSVIVSTALATAAGALKDCSEAKKKLKPHKTTTPVNSRSFPIRSTEKKISDSYGIGDTPAGLFCCLSRQRKKEQTHTSRLKLK